MKKQQPTILYVATGGGHLTELFALKLEVDNCREVIVSTHYDPTLLNCTVIKGFLPSNLITIFKCFYKGFKCLLTERPKVIITTGAEVAIPIVILGKLFFRSKVIFIESAAQLHSPSKTGKLLYWFSDRFYVQWPSMLEVYGKKARFVGGLLCSM